MIRLTVLYNLPPGTDEVEFLAWRLGEHQESNLAMPAVVRTDFSKIAETWPKGKDVPYRFMTTAEWPDWDSFRHGFYSSSVQAKLGQDVEKISDAVFLVSEVLVNQYQDAAAAAEPISASPPQ